MHICNVMIHVVNHVTVAMFWVFFIDIDECDDQMYDCSEFANCENLDGGYNCRCQSGYTGSGMACEGM